MAGSEGVHAMAEETIVGEIKSRRTSIAVRQRLNLRM